MMNNELSYRAFHRAWHFLIEILLLCMGVTLGTVVEQTVTLIPKWLIHLPDVDFSNADLRQVFLTYLGAGVILFGIRNTLFKPWRIGSIRSTVDELLLVVLLVSMASYYLFLFTTINFAPELMAAIALCVFLGVLFIHVVALGFFLRRSNMRESSRVIAQDLSSALRRLVSLPSAGIFLFALTLPVLAKLYVTDRNVANVITQLRLAFQPAQPHQYGLENAFGDLRFLAPMITQSSGSASDTYVLERYGRLYRVYLKDGYHKALVLDISGLLGKVDTENGALGFDLGPKFGQTKSNQTGYIYIYYTQVKNGSQRNHLSRFDLSLGSLQERLASELSLIDLSRNSSGFHNGGSVEFGPDGYLYVGIGEAATPKYHQRVDGSLFGGVLRLDISQNSAQSSTPILRQPEFGQTKGYAIPMGNPLAGDPNALGEFWAWGLRNPFRFSFDPATGSLWLGDVGSTVWEEVNLIRGGGNYEFPYREGYAETNQVRPTKLLGVETEPVYSYSHTAFDRAVIGGIVYRGEKWPELRGNYIFADNYSGIIRSFPADQTRVVQVTEIAQAPQYAQRGITSVTQNDAGDILVTTLGRSDQPTGRVLKLSHSGSGMKELELETQQETGVVSAESLFLANCSRCHGRTGEGDGPDTGAFDVELPNFRSPGFQASRSDTELTQAITKGGVAVGLSPYMPPWEYSLNKEEVQSLVVFIRNMRNPAP